MPSPTTLRAALLAGSVVAAATLSTGAQARERQRLWNELPPCPTDSPVLVGSEGSASRFSALSGCPDVRVIPEATPAEVSDHQAGSYEIRETARDKDGDLQSAYQFADHGTSGRDSDGDGGVRVTRDYSAGGTPVVTIAPIKDPSATAEPQPVVRVLPHSRPAPAVEPPHHGAPVNIAGDQPPVQLASKPDDERLLELRADRATPFDREIGEVARRQRIDPLLLHAVIRKESAYRANAVSRVGAIGAMQVMPGTGRMLGVAPGHLRHARTNIEAGARLLRKLAARYSGNFELVLAAYNAGEGAVRKYGNRIPPYPETRAYVAAVMGEYRRLASSAGLILAQAR